MTPFTLVHKWFSVQGDLRVPYCGCRVNSDSSSAPFNQTQSSYQLSKLNETSPSHCPYRLVVRGGTFCSLSPFVKQAELFVSPERYVSLTWALEECGSLHVGEVVQQWSTSKADMVNYSCKPWILIGGRKGRGGTGLCEASPDTGVTLEKDIQIKDREEGSYKPQSKWVEREERSNLSTRSAYIHGYAIPPVPIQGQFALGHKMTIIYQKGAHCSVDQYPMTELFSKRDIGGGECFKSLDLEAFD